MQMPEQNKAHD